MSVDTRRTCGARLLATGGRQQPESHYQRRYPLEQDAIYFVVVLCT